MVTILQMRCTEKLREDRKDMAQEPGVVQRVQRGKGTKHGSRLGRVSQRLDARLTTALG